MIVHIRPGEGGDDAAVFAAELAHAFTAFARRQGWQVSPAASDDSRSHDLHIHSDDLAVLEPFTGVHRIQRVPVNDKQGRRQTSTVTVTLSSGEPGPAVTVHEDDVRVDFFRGTGAGGQHRNKTSTAVRLTHLPTGLVITRLSGRSQSANLADAMRELQDRLTQQAAAKARDRVRSQRAEQAAAAERPLKAFTHNQQRGQVLCHRTGRSWTLRAFTQGRWTA